MDSILVEFKYNSILFGNKCHIGLNRLKTID